MDDIRRLQLEELEILKYFIRVCEENGLRYFLLGGTLLGAVRHKGFIPWDDDVDVCMPREDLNRLADLFASGEHVYEYVSYETAPEYRYSWPRLISRNMKIINRSAVKPREEYAWIDLIPLDGFPDEGVKRKLHKIKLSFWWDLNQILQFDELVDQKRKRSAAGQIAVKGASLFKGLGKMIDFHTCLKKLNETLMEYPYDSDTKDVINYLAAYGFNEVFPRGCFKTVVQKEFEGVMMNCPGNYDKVLKTIYDVNYMELPPESERNKHNSEIIE